MLSFLNKLFGNKPSVVDWETVKHSDQIYPEHSFTILKLTMQNGKLGTGWVDKSYKKYEFKEFCPYHIGISIDLTDKISENNPDLDMGTIEDFFSDELKRKCVCHVVSRLISDRGMEIECYSEENEPIEQFLKKISLAENRLVSFNHEIVYDPKWKRVNRLLNL
jgi:hypothetical protein